MQKTFCKLCDKAIWILTVFLLSCFLIFDTYTWGKYAFLLTSLLIFILYSLKDECKIKIGAFQWFFLAFIVYTFLTFFWTLDQTDTLTMARTLLRILICFSLIYCYFVSQADINGLLRAVLWSGYVVAIYSIFFYGIDTVLLATTGAATRLQNDYTNVNGIGMACALTCVIQFHEFVFDRFRWWKVFFLLLAVLMVAATQSRKAIALIFIGVLAIIALKNSDNKNFIKWFLNVTIAIAVAVVCFIVLAKLDIFKGINERLTSLFNVFANDNNVDGSTELRNKMIALGIEWWEKYPIGGVGMATPHILGGKFLGHDAYLHNNFVELLCGGGIFAFIIYYSMYVYLFINLFRYRHADKKYFSMGIIWLLIMLILDYGFVSYYSKLQWFYLMALFINVESLKKKSFRKMQGENSEYSKNCLFGKKIYQ